VFVRRERGHRSHGLRVLFPGWEQLGHDQFCDLGDRGHRELLGAADLYPGHTGAWVSSTCDLQWIPGADLQQYSVWYTIQSWEAVEAIEGLYPYELKGRKERREETGQLVV